MAFVNARRAEEQGRDRGGADPTDDHADVLESSRYSRSDLRLIRRAVDQRWPVPDTMRKAVVSKVAEKLVQPTTVDETVKLAGVVLAMEGMNQKDQHLSAKIATVEAGQLPTADDIGDTDDDRLASEIIERRRPSSLPPSTIGSVGLNGDAGHTNGVT